MKKTNKKGFTIVELVIVIAVIAILAGVLIPTFSSVVSKANESAALQAARNAYTEAMAETNGDITKLTAAQATKIATDTGATIVAVATTGTPATVSSVTFTYGAKYQVVYTISGSAWDVTTPATLPTSSLS